MRAQAGRMPWLVAAVCAALCSWGCGRAAPPSRLPSAWSATVPWSTLAVGRQGARTVGPLGAAVGGGRIAVLDSFGDALLLWSRSGGRWSGPERLPIPARGSPLTAVALAPPGSGAEAAVADGSGSVWVVGRGGATRRILSLPSSPDDVRTVVSLAWPPGGPVVADVVEIGVRSSARLLVVAATGAPARTVARARLASPDGPLPGAPAGPGWLFPAAGGGAGLAPAGSAAVWVLGRAGSRPALVRVELSGRASAPRTLPNLPAPVDFLGVGAHGWGYALAAAGKPNAALVAFPLGGRVRRTLAAPPGPGPFLPHPAAADLQGSLVLLASGAAGLHVRYIPSGRLPAAA